MVLLSLWLLWLVEKGTVFALPMLSAGCPINIRGRPARATIQRQPIAVKKGANEIYFAWPLLLKIFHTPMNNNNVLSKFQLESAPEYHPTFIYDEDYYYYYDYGYLYSQLKQVRDVLEIKTPTEFIVAAEVVELKYYIYEACPIQNTTELFCNMTLNNQSIGQTSIESQYKLYVRLTLQDLKDAKYQIHVVNPEPECFLGMTVTKMKEWKQEDVATLLQRRIGLKGHIKIKAQKGSRNEQELDLFMDGYNFPYVWDGVTQINNDQYWEII